MRKTIYTIFSIISVMLLFIGVPLMIQNINKDNGKAIGFMIMAIAGFIGLSACAFIIIKSKDK